MNVSAFHDQGIPVLFSGGQNVHGSSLQGSDLAGKRFKIVIAAEDQGRVSGGDLQGVDIRLDARSLFQLAYDARRRRS